MNEPGNSRRRAAVEIALIFIVFFIQGATPVPDVNEPYYLGKAIHYWNPDRLQGDFFLESADTHRVFYFTFGWLSLWLGPTALVWTGRVLTWLLLAWAWRRLSAAVVPRAWFSVLSAALFACLMARCHMAGEWVIGGVEAKPLAYVLVFLALEALAAKRWNRALWLAGAASALHVLVGGWTAVAAGAAWLRLKYVGQVVPDIKSNHVRHSPTYAEHAGNRPPALRLLWPGILGGLLLALPGVLPSLALDWGVDPEVARKAHQIYVFERLPHHLVLGGMKPEFIARMVLLFAFWIFLGRWRQEVFSSPALDRLRAFVAGAAAISLVGALLQLMIPFDPARAAGLLRFYWFRLTDVALPLGAALEASALAAAQISRPATFFARSGGLILAILVAAFHLTDTGLARLSAAPPKSHRVARGGVSPAELAADFADWRDACRWAADSGRVDPRARFLVPRLSQTFSWYAGRSCVATWKDVPQDAESIVQWRERIRELYETGLPPPSPRWHPTLADAGAARLRQLGEKYDADYAISQRTDPLLPLDAVYQNDRYVIYRLR